MPPEGPAHPEIAVKRRLARLLSTLTLVALASPANSLPRQSAEDFLRELYRAEAERIAHSQTLDEAAFLSLFTPQAAELLRAALAHPDPALREGPSPNALFGWNVIPGTKVMLLGVARVLGTRDAPTLIVDVSVSGVPRRIVIDLVEGNGSWRIVAIIYDEGEDFLSFEKRLARR
jgi:hypothetical protein